MEGLLARPRRLLVTVLIAVETVSILFSVLATSLALTTWGPRGEWLVLLILAPTYQFLAEIIPKSLALAYPGRLAGWVAPLVKPLIIVLAPLRVVFTQISRGLLATLGFRPGAARAQGAAGRLRPHGDSLSRGVIAEMERDFIQNLLNFGELRGGARSWCPGPTCSPCPSICP